MSNNTDFSTPLKASLPDDWPVLGFKTDNKSPFSHFANWCCANGQATIGRQIVSLLIDRREPLLLGGTLQFLADRRVRQLLAAWATGRTDLDQLLEFSNALVDVGLNYPAPDPGQQIQSQIRESIEFHYFGAHFSARHPPHLAHRERLKLTVFRVWLLIKALEFGRAGHLLDANLAVAMTQVRLAVDERGDPQRLFKILSIIPQFNDDLHWYQVQLFQVAKKSLDNESNSIDSMRRAIRNIVEGRSRAPAFAADWNQQRFFAIAEAENLHWTASLQQPERSGTSDLEGDIAKSVDDVLEVEVDEDHSAPELANASRHIVFQSAEDRQYFSYAWTRLRVDERKSLHAELSRLLVESNPTESLLPTIAIVAILTRHSLDTVRRIPLSATSSDTWSLDVQLGLLHRLPVRRVGRWQATSASNGWIQSLQNEPWQLRLSTTLASILQTASSLRGNATVLGDLWSPNPLTLEAAFIKVCKTLPPLIRIRSGMLARSSEQVIFEKTQDHVFAELITHPSGAGIPGSGAYPSWSGSEVESGLQIMAPSTHASVAGPAKLYNAMGSELDPLDQMLRQAFAEASRRCEASASEATPWIQRHNSYTIYVVTALLAATGARPVEAIFESVRHFDFQANLVFISDKVSDSSDGAFGRVVPLPASLSTHVRDIYLPHLRQVAQKLQSNAPSLAQAISDHESGLGSTQLPFFFLLTSIPCLDWQPVTPARLKSAQLFDWPLPWNLFRHRLATRLRTHRLEAELIDSLLGHSDFGATTFGDHSNRCWINDLAAMVSTLEACFAALNIRMPSAPNLNFGRSLTFAIEKDYDPFDRLVGFGSHARSKRREHAHRQAKVQTRSEIASFLGGREPSSLSSADWERLLEHVLRRDGNLPRANQAARIAELDLFVQRAWKSNGTRPKIRHWYTRRPTESDHLPWWSIGARSRLLDLRTKFIQEIAIVVPSRVSLARAAALCALGFSLFCRIADSTILEVILSAQREKLRLVRYQGHSYLEFGTNFKLWPDQPVKRFLIPTTLTSLFNRILLGSEFIRTPTLPASLEEPCKAATAHLGGMNTDSRTLVHAVSLLVDAENRQLLPGHLAAWLGGRMASWSLPHRDWQRWVSGQAKRNPDHQEALTSADPVEPLKARILHRASTRADISDREIANRDFIRVLRGLLVNYVNEKDAETDSPVNSSEGVSHSSRLRRTNTRSQSRRQLKARIGKHARTANTLLSPSLQALGLWVEHLMDRPVGSQLLNVKSILRYFSALSFRFEAFLADADLAEMDEEEFTEVYSYMVQTGFRTHHEGESTDSGLDDEVDMPIRDSNSASYSGTPNASKDAGYVVARLRDFHGFAQRQWGLESPDWSEIGGEANGAGVSAGYISPAEYLHALKTLCNDPESAEPERVQDAFVLLLCYRFGLRSGEAIGMSRDEWVDCVGAIVVLVTRKRRSLKTRASQRQVPLVGSLNSSEEAVIKRHLSHWQIEASRTPLSFLFFDPANPTRPQHPGVIRARLISALRSATLNPGTTLHHARHSFASNLAAMLLSTEDSIRIRFQPQDLGMIGVEVQKLLLGVDHSNTRRAPWILARMLGHTGPTTTFGSYLHHLGDELAHQSMLEFGEMFVAVSSAQWTSAIGLDRWDVDECYLLASSAQPSINYRPLTPQLACEYLWLRARGSAAQAVGLHLSLAPYMVNGIENFLALIADRSKQRIEDTPTDRVSKWLAGTLSRIPGPRWKALMDAVCSLKVDVDAVGLGSMEEWAATVGETRQVLLFSEEHACLARELVAKLRWSEADYRLVGPKVISPQMSEWLACAGLQRPELPSSDEKHRFQLNVVRYSDERGREVRVDQRVGWVRAESNRIVDTNLELLSIWVGHVISICLGGMASDTESIRSVARSHGASKIG